MIKSVTLLTPTGEERFCFIDDDGDDYVRDILTNPATMPEEAKKLFMNSLSNMFMLLNSVATEFANNTVECQCGKSIPYHRSIIHMNERFCSIECVNKFGKKIDDV